MIPGFGKQQISIGCAPNCDVVIVGPDVLLEHARLVHNGGGKLDFIPVAPGITVREHLPGGQLSAERALARGEIVPFDFRSAFVISSVPVPVAHPAIVLAIMAAGQHAVPRGRLVIGRDAGRASLVIQHPAVSSQHATIMLDRMVVLDHGSTSGTFVDGGNRRLPPNQPAPLDPNGVVAFGPVKVSISLLMQLAQAGSQSPRAALPLLGPISDFMSGGPFMQASACAPAVDLERVHLGVTVPRIAQPGERFVVRVAGYTADRQQEILALLEREAPGSAPRLGLAKCRWRRGAAVSVRVECEAATFEEPTKTFEWDGEWEVLRFDAQLAAGFRRDSVAVRVDVAVGGVTVAQMRPEMQVRSDRRASDRLVHTVVPQTAFASYSADDRADVLGRIRSLQVATNIDVFVDCLSLHPGEQWLPRLRGEIARRDAFWLFWSRSAARSPWVEWEWREALIQRSLDRIQPHPLEPAELAPPPAELAALQFGAAAEWLIMLGSAARKVPRQSRSFALLVDRRMRFTVIEDEIVGVGRDAGACTMVVASERVSELHASLKLSDGRLFVHDHNSRHGTTLDGETLEACEWHEVPNGSDLCFGDRRFAVQIVG